MREIVQLHESLKIIDELQGLARKADAVAAKELCSDLERRLVRDELLEREREIVAGMMREDLSNDPANLSLYKVYADVVGEELDTKQYTRLWNWLIHLIGGDHDDADGCDCPGTVGDADGERQAVVVDGDGAPAPVPDVDAPRAGGGGGASGEEAVTRLIRDYVDFDTLAYSPTSELVGHLLWCCDRIDAEHREACESNDLLSHELKEAQESIKLWRDRYDDLQKRYERFAPDTFERIVADALSRFAVPADAEELVRRCEELACRCDGVTHVQR